MWNPLIQVYIVTNLTFIELHTCNTIFLIVCIQVNVLYFPVQSLRYCWLTCVMVLDCQQAMLPAQKNMSLPACTVSLIEFNLE